jgi:predicted nucleic acid-binding protein
MLLVDTNVLVDVLQDDPQWAEWSIAQLRAQASIHELAINPVVYAELSLSFATVEALDDVVETMQLVLREIPRPALFLAGKAFLQYRRRGGSKAQVLPDFLIGAHAAVQGWPVLTRDASRYRTCFPSLHVIAP